MKGYSSLNEVLRGPSNMFFKVFLNNKNSGATDQNTLPSENLFSHDRLVNRRKALNVKTQDVNSSTFALSRARTLNFRDQFQFF